MSDDKDNKTEEPTGRRLDDARSKGQVAQSREVAHLIMVSAMLVVILMLGPLMTRDLALLLRRFVEQPHQMHIDGDTFHFMMIDVSGQLGAVLAVPLLLLLAAAFAPSLLQNGFLWSTTSLTPKLERISPFSGIGRLFSLRNATELVKGIVKMAIVGTLATVMMLPLFNILEQYISTDVVMLLPALLSLSVKLLSGVILILMLVAGVDYTYQRYEFMKSLRMSKSEVKDEFKQMEGDPVIKAALRRIRQQRARTRMMAAVPTATVVVTNPTHFACALKYDPGMNAPLLVAKGVDLLALRIIDKARENFIPVVENPPLARTLFAAVEVDAEIPREHYKAVAEIIGYVMRLKKRAVR